MLASAVFYLWFATLASLALLAATAPDFAVRWNARIVVVSAGSGIAVAHLLPHWWSPHPELFVIDVMATVAMVATAVIDARPWSATAAGVQGAHVGLHIIYFLDRSHVSAAYYTGFAILGFTLAGVIFFGAMKGGRCNP